VGGTLAWGLTTFGDNFGGGCFGYERGTGPKKKKTRGGEGWTVVGEKKVFKKKSRGRPRDMHCAKKRVPNVSGADRQILKYPQKADVYTGQRGVKRRKPRKKSRLLSGKRTGKKVCGGPMGQVKIISQCTIAGKKAAH